MYASSSIASPTSSSPPRAQGAPRSAAPGDCACASLGAYERDEKAFGPVLATVMALGEVGSEALDAVSRSARSGLAQAAHAGEAVLGDLRQGVSTLERVAQEAGRGAVQTVQAGAGVVADAAGAVGDAAGDAVVSVSTVAVAGVGAVALVGLIG